MEQLSIFVSTFFLVFIGEFGDKSQFTAGTSSLANRSRVWLIYTSSVLALIAVAGLTVFGVHLIPVSWLQHITKIGGIGLIVYAVYLFFAVDTPESETEIAGRDNGWMRLFVANFAVVFTAEFADKTQFATLAAAIENPSHRVTVFAASAAALIGVTSLTVWSITKVPASWTVSIQRLGAIAMAAYGLYMLF